MLNRQNATHFGGLTYFCYQNDIKKERFARNFCEPPEVVLPPCLLGLALWRYENLAYFSQKFPPSSFLLPTH